METEQFDEENYTDLQNILNDECQMENALLLDIINMKQKNDLNEEYKERYVRNSLSESIETYKSKKSKKIRRQRSKIIRDAITTMILFNNVIPLIDDNDANNIIYQASSHDEMALFNFAESLSMKFNNRIDKEIKMFDAANNIEEYAFWGNFPFSSDTKRMGIILK